MAAMMRAMRRVSLAAALLAPSAVTVAGPGPQEPARTEAVVRGTVVDENGAPVAGAMVDLLGWKPRGLGLVRIEPVPTGPDGGFVFRSDRTVRPSLVRATADGGARLGVAQIRGQDLARVGPVRLVLRPSRPLIVRVVDDAGKPVAGAAVEVVVGGTGVASGAVDPGATDDLGIAGFRVPADMPVRGVLALRDGVGVDYFSNTRGIPQLIPIGPSPEEVSLTLRGTRTVTLRALDSGGRPIPGVAFRLDAISLKGHPSRLFGATRITEVTTDADGLARWPWVPEECDGGVSIGRPKEDLEEEASPHLSSYSKGDTTLNVLLWRMVRLSGRVINADGSPAPGVTVNAKGLGKFSDGTAIVARTGEGGSYTMLVRPERSYLIAVTGPNRAAEPISDVFIREGERHDGLDFRLIEGTRLHGRVAIRPGAQRYIEVYLLGDELPAAQQRPREKERLRLSIPAMLDGQGGYEARLGPGDYEIFAVSHREHPTIHVDGAGEFVLNFLGDLTPLPVLLNGVVVEKAPGGGERPPKGGVSVEVAGTSFRTRPDEAGRFAIQRPDDDIGLYVRGVDGGASMKVAKGVDEIKVVLGPSVMASGRVVDSSGRPFAGEGPSMLMSDGPGGLPGLGNIKYLSKFEPGGRYEFKGLILGAEYKVIFPLFRDSGALDILPIKTFRVAGPGPIDLGEFVVPAERAAPR